MEKKKRVTLTKSETETIEFIRLVTHIPLNNIHETLKGLSAAIGLKYAEALQKAEDGKETEIVLDLPYIGKLVMQKDSLVIDWHKHSLLLNELTNVKKAVDYLDDSELLDMWYERLIDVLHEKLEE